MTASKPTGIVDHPVYREHRPGPGHPERPARCDAVISGIRAAVNDDRLPILEAREATEAEIAYCHTYDYIDIVEADVQDSVKCLRTGDTDVSDCSLDAALMAAGGVIAATDAVMGASVRNAFCIVRPPGHHATSARGMGFCIFNNIAVAARHVQKIHGIERVLIADWDLHHGNGTQDIFYEDPSVFYFSTHQWPCYPGTGLAGQTGLGPGKGYTVNCPVAAGSGGTEVLGAFRQHLVPAMREFKPQFVLISAGFDGHRMDPFGALALSDDDFADLTRLMLDVADQHAEGRLVSVLEGGYNLDALSSAAGQHVKVLSGSAASAS